FHDVGTAITQSKVVFLAATLIAMPFDRKCQARMFFHPGSITVKSRKLIRTNLALIVFEIDRLDVLPEELVHTDIWRRPAVRSRRCGWGCWNTNCDSCAVGGGSTRSGFRCNVGYRR